MRKFLAILWKELLSFMRSWQLVLVVVYAFTVEVYIAGGGIELKPRHVVIGYVDDTGGGLSQKILSHLHEPEFLEPLQFRSQEELSRAIFEKQIVIGMVFDEHFEKNFRQYHTTKLDVLIDATAAAQAYTAISYIQNILLGFSNIDIPIDLALHKLFNENADNATFISLTELMSITTMLAVILTAVVFVREKEQGTWDIMLLMPVSPYLVIFAKSLSQVIIIMIGIVLSLGLVVFGQFHTPLNGSLAIFLALSFFYVLATAGIGLFIAALAKDVMQVAQLAMVIMMPLIFLSGAWTPIFAMHPFLQWFSYLSPLRYYIEGTESLFFRGTQGWDLWPYFAGVICVGGIMYGLGVKKLGRLF